MIALKKTIKFISISIFLFWCFVAGINSNKGQQVTSFYNDETYNKYEEKDTMKTVQEFLDVAENQGIRLLEDEIENITKTEFFEETGAQIFLNRHWEQGGRSLLLSGGKVYELTKSTGIQDYISCDLNNDGKKEMLYASEAGSGVTYTFFHILSLDTMQQMEIDMKLMSEKGDAKYLRGKKISFLKKDDSCVEVYAEEIQRPIEIFESAGSYSVKNQSYLLGVIRAKESGIVFEQGVSQNKKFCGASLFCTGNRKL